MMDFKIHETTFYEFTRSEIGSKKSSFYKPTSDKPNREEEIIMFYL